MRTLPGARVKAGDLLLPAGAAPGGDDVVVQLRAHGGRSCASARCRSPSTPTDCCRRHEDDRGDPGAGRNASVPGDAAGAAARAGPDALRRRRKLLIRVYPDEIHLDSHQEGLTAAEGEWGRRYWELIWPAAGDVPAQRRAWDALAERFGARRAAWIARRLTPTNLAARPGTPPVFPDTGPARAADASPAPVARALPDRWIVMGYNAAARARCSRPARRSPRRSSSARAPTSRPGRRPRPGSCRSTRACAGWSTSRRPRRSGWASASHCPPRRATAPCWSSASRPR